MKRRIYRKRGPLPFKVVILVSFGLFTVLSVISSVLVNKNIEPAIMAVAQTKATQFASQSINDAIASNVVEEIDIRELIVKHESNNGDYSFNPQVYNKIIAETTKEVQHSMHSLDDGYTNSATDSASENDGVVYFIPLGMATRTTLFSNLGPDIPVKLEMIGDVVTNIETKIRELGINNTYLEVYVDVSLQVNVIIPFISEPIKVANTVKIGDLFIQGKVPQYYHGGGGNGQFAPVIMPPEEEDDE
ncbi:sporulation protein YunB [Sutcliffiella rhizosphaerae]|uniref:Sporulation protein YunB n=1 Tax=Sutcliffiella rhizosphaerae TaxID=2880967 RepID=A0ABN8ACS6_9BACI|nr:sporulation protein YunB [Sutcliffiella rhizosphaerae]CAG9623041.1 Sporulation protein YunB [Sutcliffiella rhizosphaerae]